MKRFDFDRGCQRAIHAKIRTRIGSWEFRYVPLLPLNNQRYLPKKRDSRPLVADRIAAMSCAGHAASHDRLHPDIMPPNLRCARLCKQYTGSGLSRDVLLNRRLLDATENYGNRQKAGESVRKADQSQNSNNTLSRAESEALLGSACHNRVL